MAFPTFTKTFHNTTYPAISPARPELSTKGKVVFITGGGSGLGVGITHAFATSGTTKIAILGRTASSLASTKKDVEAKHPEVKVLTFVASIADEEAVTAAFESTKKEFGPVDILVQNAAYLPDIEPIATAKVADFVTGLTVNIVGTLVVAKAFAANSAPNSTLIHISTAAALAPAMAAGFSGYTASKAGAVNVINAFAFEHPNIRVMILHPGIIDTPMNKKCVEAGFRLPYDEESLATNFIVWTASPEAEFLKGKFVWSNWDVEELIAKKEAVASSPILTIGLNGWVEGITSLES